MRRNIIYHYDIIGCLWRNFMLVATTNVTFAERKRHILLEVKNTAISIIKMPVTGIFKKLLMNKTGTSTQTSVWRFLFLLSN